MPSALLRHPQGNVLFDTGCHPSVATDAEARWGSLAQADDAGDDARTTTSLTGLACIGLEPDDIDVVISSHLHPDHCGCNAFFKRATLIVHARELEAARAPGAEAQGYLAAEWDHADADRRGRAATATCSATAASCCCICPGHTPGSIGALVRLDRSGTILLASDTVSLRETLDQGIIPRNTWNAEALEKSLAEIRRIAAGGATVICGHDDRQWQTLRKGADAYD